MTLRTWIVVAAVAALAAPAWGRVVERTVRVQETHLHAQASFFSPRAGSLAYGDVVRLIETQGSWARVQHGERAGWVPVSSLTDRRVELVATGDAGTGVTTEETTLAGKGLSEQMEDEYRKIRPEADFGAVDRMEARGVRRDDVLNFLRQGGLAGGAR